ncbi:phosphoribosyltransferase family protein [Campylobacter sp. MG1]|uniref:phosphoribosyltransferase family protein n=1 Tax=Campylobacter sp. MG1 TaxID=2976332 RepID=UPI00226CC04B|nr:phosphoribosyltransferase family protein [Campylobacter sp. MG1]
MIFDNPIQAASEFCQVLAECDELKDHIIIGNSIKNIPFVETIANELNLYYDMLFNKSIYAPNNECQIAKISETKDIVFISELIEAFSIKEDYIMSISKVLYDEAIMGKVAKYRHSLPLSDLKEKDILILDQGSNSGLTLNLCHKSLLGLGVKSIKYASALMPCDAYDYYTDLFDKVYYLEKIEHFIDKDYYYKQPLEISSEYACEILETSNYYLPYQKEINEKNN